VRVRVIAEAVPLARFAAALSEALRVTIVVATGALDHQVSVATPDATVDRLLRLLVANDVGYVFDAGEATLLLDSLEDMRAMQIDRARGCYDVVETRILPLPHDVPQEHVARYFCERVASPQGAADVVAGRLLLRDYPANLNQIESFVLGLTERRGERSPPPSRVNAR
jgi:hypothetical protein